MDRNRCLALLALLALVFAPSVPAAGPEGGACARMDAGSTFIRLDLPFQPEFTAAAWMPDGSSMVVAGPDGWIARYYPGNRTFVNISARGPAWLPDYEAVAISPASSEALVAGERGMAVAVAPDNSIELLPTGSGNDIRGASFTGDGSAAFLAGGNRTLVRFDPNDRKMTVLDDLLMPALADLPADIAFGALSFRPDGQYALLAAPEAGRLFRLTPDSLVEITFKFDGLADPTGLSWSPDGARALVPDNGSRAFVWDGNGESSVRIDGPPGSQFELSAWRDDTSASLLSLGGAPSLYDYAGLPAFESAQTFPASSFRAMAWSPDGREGFIFAVEGPNPVAYHFREGDLAPTLELVQLSSTTAGLAWNWNGTAAQDHTDIYISKDEGTLFNRISETLQSDKSKIFSPLTPGTRYFAAIRVYFATVPPVEANSSVLSFTTSGRNPVPKPSTPVLSDINATAVYLTWSWSPGASGETLDHYLLLHSTSEADLLNATPLNAYTNTSGRLYNLSPSTKYYLLMRVVTATGLTADSDVESFSTTAFVLPQSVSPHFEGNSLLWMPSPSLNITRYEVYYSQYAGQAIDTMTLAVTRTAGQSSYTYDLSGQVGSTFREGTTYYFRVRTVNRDGATADSGEVAFTYNTAPAAVPAVKVSDITYNSVRLSWGRSGASDFSAYIIEYRQYMTGTWKTAVKVTGQNTTSAVVGSLAPDTMYEFRIKVQDKGGKTSPVTAWAVHPRTDENIAYEIFSTIFGDPVVCLPISFMMLFMTTAAAAGMAKSKSRGSAVFATFAAGFGVLAVANLLQLLEVWQPSPELKLILFLVPLPIAAAIVIARRARRRSAGARSAEENRRRQAAEEAALRQKRAGELQTTLASLGPRLQALERQPGLAGTAAARALLQQAGYAYSTGNLDPARELAGRAEAGITQMEDTNRDRQSQAETITKRLETVDSLLKTLIEQWLKYDPVAELGLDPLRIDRTRLDAAHKEEDARLQSAQAKQQQAGVLLGEGRLSEARDMAAAAQSEVDRLLDAWNRWKDLKEQAGSLQAAIENAASWAAIDGRAYQRRVEEAKLALAVQDGVTAAATLNAVKAEVDALGQTHRPALAIALPAQQYRLNRFEDFQFTVRNAGKAVARKIDIMLEAPADFGPGGNQPAVKLVSMAAGGSQDCRLNLAFTREGSVPVLFTVAYEDNAGNRIVQEPVRLTANVMGR